MDIEKRAQARNTPKSQLTGTKTSLHVINMKTHHTKPLAPTSSTAQSSNRPIAALSPRLTDWFQLHSARRGVVSGTSTLQVTLPKVTCHFASLLLTLSLPYSPLRLCLGAVKLNSILTASTKTAG